MTHLWKQVPALDAAGESQGASSNDLLPGSGSTRPPS